MSDLFLDLRNIIHADCLHFGVTLSDYSTMRVGGPAACFAEPETEDEILRVLDYVKFNNIPCHILGNGSNTVFSDAGFDGIILHLGSSFSEIKLCQNRIIAQSGALLSGVSRAALGASLTGLEFASGIPGSVGGAVCMNAGAYGGEIAQVLTSVRVLRDGKIVTLSNSECAFGYRQSAIMQHHDVVLSAEFTLNPGDFEQIQATMRDFSERRRAKQPLQFASCGSFFKRPAGYYAGALIEQSGLKGTAVGDAQISDLHAGFLINRGHATAEDIITLMHFVQNTVSEKFSVRLEPEVCFIGDFSK